MSDSRFQWIAPSTRADDRDPMRPLPGACWPEFMLHEPIADRYRDDLFPR